MPYVVEVVAYDSHVQITFINTIYTAFFDTVFNLEYHTNTFVLCLYVRLGQLIKEDSTRMFLIKHTKIEGSYLPTNN